MYKTPGGGERGGQRANPPHPPPPGYTRIAPCLTAPMPRFHHPLYSRASMLFLSNYSMDPPDFCGPGYGRTRRGREGGRGPSQWSVSPSTFYAVFCCPFFPIRDLWMWGMTPAERKEPCSPRKAPRKRVWELFPPRSGVHPPPLKIPSLNWAGGDRTHLRQQWWL